MFFEKECKRMSKSRRGVVYVVQVIMSVEKGLCCGGNNDNSMMVTIFGHICAIQRHHRNTFVIVENLIIAPSHRTAVTNQA